MDQLLDQYNIPNDPQERAKFKNDNIAVASKSVLYLLMDTISHTDLTAPTKEYLCDRVKKSMPRETSATMKIEFAEDNELVLHLALSIVPAEHLPTVMLPSMDYKDELFRKYDIMKTCALMFWVDWKNTFVDLVAELREYEVPLELVIDPNNYTALAFNLSGKQRVGIVVYYKNVATGEILVRKNNATPPPSS
jgi:hypothetical protein